MPREISHILIADLYTAYMEIKRDYESRGYFLSRQQICDILSKASAPRFYITPYTALRSVIMPMEQGKTPRSKGLRKGMHLELFQKYLSLRSSYGRSVAIQLAITQNASSYYLSARHIDKLLYDAVHI